MRIKPLLFVIFILPLVGFSQLSKEDKLDSLRAKLTADSSYLYRYKKYKFLLAIDTRNSFIHSDKKVSIDIAGVQLGVVINDRHDLGLGFYSALGSAKTHPIKDDQSKILNVNIKMGYATVFYEYAFIDTKRWEVGVPVELGMGTYQQTVTDSSGKRVPNFADTLQKGITLLGAGLDVSFRVWRWLGLNAMGGYRIVHGNEPKKINLNGAFYSYGVQIYFGELYRMYRLGVKRRLYRNAVEKVKKLPD